MCIVAIGSAVWVPGASAAPGELASGVVVVDANANGVIDTGAAGEVDRGIAGVSVEVVAGDGVTVLASTVTAADGSWSVAESDVAPQPVVYPLTVRINSSGANGNVYETSATVTAGVNDFTRDGGPNQAVATVQAAATVLNALVHPAWILDAQLANDPDGLGGKSIITGAPDFDPDDSQPGWDSGPANARVRTSDIVAFNWSLTATSDDGSLGGTFANAVFEQTIALSGGAVANFASVPAICDSVHSRIVAYPSGTPIAARADLPAGTTSVVLSCVLGQMGVSPAASAYLLNTQVQPSAKSPSGSSLAASARFYAVDSDGVATARSATGPGMPSVEVTAAPRYDVEKLVGSVSNNIATRNGEPGHYAYYTVQISADRQVGVEAFAQPITLEESLWATVPPPGGSNQQLTDLRWYLTECIPSPAPAISSGQIPTTLVYGRIGAQGSVATPENSVRDSGTCAIGTRSEPDTGNYQLSLSGIDASGATYPTKTASGTSLAAGKFYVASYRLRIFIPLSEMDRADGVVDGTGALSFYNRVGGFDPVGISGESNYGDDVEPGFCAPGGPTDQATKCATMNEAARSNNVVGPNALRVIPGSWAKYIYNHWSGWAGGASVLPESVGSHDGAGQVQPGQAFTSTQILNNTGSVGMAGAQLCDVFDNTMVRIVPLNRDGSVTNPFADGLYSVVLRLVGGITASVADSQANQVNWVTEYGVVDLTGDNPNLGEFDVANNRWQGDWSRQKAVVGAGSCGDAAMTWYPSPESVPGGVDAVNTVRLRAVNGYVLPPGESARWLLAFEQRDTFNGGPHAGESIETGTIAANFGSVRSDTWSTNWLVNQYIPGAGMTGGLLQTGESSHGDGERWTVTRAQMRLQKRTIAVSVAGESSTGVADFGVVGTAIAGRPVVWEISGAVTAVSAEPSAVQNVVITDTLPEFVVYDEAGTIALGGMVPSATVNADGTTTLVWLLGDRMPNAELPVLQVATYTSPLAPPNATVVNEAVITADSVAPAFSHVDTHTIRIEQSGQVQLAKSVDEPIDMQDADQEFTLALRNFSETLAIQAPTVYEALPYNGDGSNAAGTDRTPASDFEGSSVLVGAPVAQDWLGGERTGTFYYTTVPGAQVPQSQQGDTDSAIWSTAFTPNATGFKFVADGPLTTTVNAAGSGLRIVFSTKQTGNAAGDVYTNRFSAVSPTLDSGNQLLSSNTVSVRVAGFSLGDFIWLDMDRDGKYSAGVDQPAPEGVEVVVHRADGTLAATTTTLGADKSGRWVVNDLPAGSYYVSIPATAFAAGGLLAGAGAGPGAVIQPDTGVNEGGDHHAIPLVAGGVRSAGLITLSANSAASPIVGLEPLADNVASLGLTPLTTDDFTNFTLDLALVPPVDFTVDKTVVGSGAQWANGPYDIEVSCVLDGVPAPGYPRAVTITKAMIDDGTSLQTLTAPLGSVCSAGETDQGGATSVSVLPVDGVTLAQVDGTYALGVENSFDTGSLRIRKDVIGVGADLDEREFTFAVVCTFRGQDTINTTVTLPDDQGSTGLDGEFYSRVWDGVPVGARCLIDETETAGADSTPASVSITIDNDPVTVQTAGFVNEYSAGVASVTKTLDGAGGVDPLLTDLQYQVWVSCALGEGPDQALFYDGPLWLTPGEVVSLDVNGLPVQMPAGAHCWVKQEVVSQGASDIVLSHDSYEDGVVVAPGEATQVQALDLEVTNVFEVAELVVTKTVVGPDPGGSYPFEVSCTYQVTSDGGLVEDVPYTLGKGDDAFTLQGGQSRTIPVLAGVQCTVVEVNVPAQATATYTDSDTAQLGSGTDGIITVVSGRDNQVVVTNTYPEPVLPVDPVDPVTPTEPTTNGSGLAISGAAGVLTAILIAIGCLLAGATILQRRRTTHT